MSGKARGFRAQASLDFIISYGLALLVIGIATYVVLQIGVFSPSVAPRSCTAIPSFLCISYTIATNSVLTIDLAQAASGTVQIVGAACSSATNTIGDRPAYGNVAVLAYSNAPQFYPNTAMQSPINLYSDTDTLIRVYCYRSSGPANSVIGSTFTGSLWLNYTVSNLPVSYVMRVASFTAGYA